MSKESIQNIGESAVTVVPATWPSAQTAFPIEVLLSKWKFFLPPTDLVGRVLEMNDKLGDDYFGKLFEATTARERTDPGGEEESIQSGVWFRWLLRQLSDVLLHREKRRNSLSNDESISLFQKFIAERIYNHLAMLARTGHTESGEFSIKEELTDELAEKIGLGLYLHSETNAELRSEIEKLLIELAYAFQQWLVVDQGGSYSTTWGSICTPNARDEMILEDTDSEPIILLPDVQDQSRNVIGRFFRKSSSR